MSTIADLWSVQVTDLAIEALRRRLADIERQLGANEELEAARQAAAAAEAELSRWRQQHRSIENESRDLERRIRAAEADLMSGRVRNPKELAAMEANVAAMRRHHSTLDDSLLEAMVEIERCQTAWQAAHTHLKQVEAAWQTQQAALLAERERARAEAQALSARLQQQWAAIAPADRELYRNLRSRKGGRAIALLQRDTCQGCGMVLPTGIIQQVHAASLGEGHVFCPTCGRLLYSSS